MKQLLTIALALVFGFATLNSTAYSQSKDDKKKEKQEKKQWKKKAKDYVKSPLTLKKETENHQKQVTDLTSQNKDLTVKNGQQKISIDSLINIINQRNSEIASLKSKNEKLELALQECKQNSEKQIVKGLVYKVQLGAFVHFDINKYLSETGEMFEGENADGFNKYTVGQFRDYETAENFKKDIRKMGIKDAWVVPVIDGKRVTHDEAKKYLQSQGITPPTSTDVPPTTPKKKKKVE